MTETPIKIGKWFYLSARFQGQTYPFGWFYSYPWKKNSFRCNSSGPPPLRGVNGREYRRRQRARTKRR